MAKQTDNHNPDAKLLLRKYFLEKYHADGSATVFDCCQGGGLMWGTIRNTHPVASYWGVDVKPKKGRLKIDSIRVVEQGLWQNVIDIDTYGSPWKHWVALLQKLNGAKTVFLTIGTKNTMPRKVSMDELALIGCEIENLPAPFAMKLQDICTDAMLAAALKVATIVEAQEATRGVAARYIGVRLEPKKDGQHVSDADRQHTSVEKELKHV